MPSFFEFESFPVIPIPNWSLVAGEIIDSYPFFVVGILHVMCDVTDYPTRR